MSEAVRAFVGIPVSQKLGLAFRALQSDVERHARGYARWTALESIHMTLYFLGENPQERVDVIEKALGMIRRPSFTLTAKGVIALPKPEVPRVVAVEMGGDVERLAELQADVAKVAAGLAEHKETKPFLPHVTIGRSKREAPGPPKVLGEAVRRVRLQPTGAWRVESFSLIQSHLETGGPRYETIREYRLG